MIRRIVPWLLVALVLAAMVALRLADEKERHGPAPSGSPVAGSSSDG